MISASSTDLSDIFEVLEQAHQYQGYITGLCPFHPDTRPSFFVYPDRYFCKACGASGFTDKLLYRLGKVARPPAIRTQRGGGSDNPFTGWAAARPLKATLRMAWETVNNNPGMGYYMTKNRGITEPYRKKLGIGYIDDWYTIPIRTRTGSIVGAVARKGRDNPSPHKYVLPNGIDPNLLYVPNWKKTWSAPYLLLTFGILDAVVLAILGYPAASTLTGKNLPKAALARFRKPVLVIPDQGEQEDGLYAVQKLGWRGSLVRVRWPEGCKDINDIWVRDPQLCKEIVQEMAHGTIGSLGDQRWTGPDQTLDAPGGDR